MKHLKFTDNGIQYRIQVTKKQTGSNYNLFAHLFKDREHICGTSFNDNTTNEGFIEWGIRKVQPTVKKDLLEDYTVLPESVQVLLSNFEPSYENCAKIRMELLSLGYNVEYGLDAELTELTPINVEVLSMDECTMFLCQNYGYRGVDGKALTKDSEMRTLENVRLEVLNQIQYNQKESETVYIEKILNRKRNGIDCTETESAEIKGYLKSTPESEMVEQIKLLFPLEYGEYIHETSTITGEKKKNALNEYNENWN